MNARDLMTRDPRTCEPRDDLTRPLQIMRDEDCGIVPVTKGNGQNRVVGVVTDRDIALALGEADERPSQIRVETIMTRNLVACGPTAEVEEITRRMEQAQVRRILVLEGDRLLGVIATADLARAAARSASHPLADEVEHVIEKVSEPRAQA